MIYYKTDEQIELLRENCLLVSKVLTDIAGKIRPGMTGAQLDKEAEELIRDHGAVPGFKGLYGCPSTLLISINEQVVHGLPSTEPFKDGDIVSIDCGDGWTIVTKDGTPSAHYEHTVAVRKGGADILSNHIMIEEAISKNKELQEVIAREPIKV